MTEQEAREQAAKVLRMGAVHDMSESNQALLAQRVAKALLAASKPSPDGVIEVDGVLYGQHTIRLLQSLVHDCIAAGFIDNAMNVRKVLGTLPLTADGCVIGDECVIYAEDANWRTMGRQRFYEYHVSDLRTRRPFWSTRSAAEAAREAKA